MSRVDTVSCERGGTYPTQLPKKTFLRLENGKEKMKPGEPFPIIFMNFLERSPIFIRQIPYNHPQQEFQK